MKIDHQGVAFRSERSQRRLVQRMLIELVFRRAALQFDSTRDSLSSSLLGCRARNFEIFYPDHEPWVYDETLDRLAREAGLAGRI